MGTLYLVSTPIGNMEDITERAKRILAEVNLIACEDTRKTGMLLSRLGLPKKELLSYYEENELARIPGIIRSLQDGQNVALVSNAGTPVIADPGFKLVRESIRQGINVVPVPGPSAVVTALVTSGLPTDKFLFLGYLPKKISKKQKLWEQLKNIEATVILYESPYRLLKTLEEVRENFDNIDIVICRELTKVYEEIRREKISDSISHFEKNKPQGEFTILMRYSDPGSD